MEQYMKSIRLELFIKYRTIQGFLHNSKLIKQTYLQPKLSERETAYFRCSNHFISLRNKNRDQKYISLERTKIINKLNRWFTELFNMMQIFILTHTNKIMQETIRTHQQTNEMLTHANKKMQETIRINQQTNEMLTNENIKMKERNETVMRLLQEPVNEVVWIIND